MSKTDNLFNIKLEMGGHFAKKSGLTLNFNLLCDLPWRDSSNTLVLKLLNLGTRNAKVSLYLQRN